MSTPEETLNPEPVEESSALFTDQPANDMALLGEPEYDGAEPSAEPAPVAEPIETKAGEKMLRLDMGNGHVYVAKTERELLQKVVDGKKEADRFIRELQAQKAAPAPMAASLTIAPRTPPPSGELPDGPYSDQTYLDLLGKDTIAARRYQDRYYYGDLDPVAALQRSYTVANQVDQQLIAADFHRRNEDFPASPEAVETLMGILQERALPVNLVNLEWGFSEGKKRGSFGTTDPDGAVEYEDVTFGSQPNPAPRQQQPRTVSIPTRRGGGVPPIPPRSTTDASTTPPVDLERMPMKDLRAMLQKSGVLRH